MILQTQIGATKIMTREEFKDLAEEFLDELYDKIFLNTPKYKEGDVVRIRSDLKVDYDNGIVEEMVELAGKTATIEEVDDDGSSKLCYKIDADKEFYWWSDECFE